MDNQTNINQKTSSQPIIAVARSFSLPKVITIFVSIFAVMIPVGIGSFIMATKSNKLPLKSVSKQEVKALPTISQPSPTPDPAIKDWKTYTNTDEQFSVKYPPAWDQVVVDKNKITILPKKQTVAKTTSPNTSDTNGISITTANNSNHLFK